MQEAEKPRGPSHRLPWPGRARVRRLPKGGLWRGGQRGEGPGPLLLWPRGRAMAHKGPGREGTSGSSPGSGPVS